LLIEVNTSFGLIFLIVLELTLWMRSFLSTTK